MATADSQLFYCVETYIRYTFDEDIKVAVDDIRSEGARQVQYTFSIAVNRSSRMPR